MEIDMRCYLEVQLFGGGSIKIPDCISFSISKRLYYCFAYATGKFYMPKMPTFSAFDIKRIRLYVNNVLSFDGLADSVEIKREKSGWIIDFTSRSFTVLLAQNEPYPKINSDCDLNGLIKKNLNISEIVCESGTPVVGYIYVKEKSNIWDAVRAYSLKATGNFPYIRRTNTVCVTMNDSVMRDFSGVKLIEQGTRLMTSSLLSGVHMADIDGGYSYEKSDELAGEYGIVREKYDPLDMQWLYSTDEGLDARIGYAARQVRTRFVTYAGYRGEELMDKVSGLSYMNAMRINSIRISGSKSGIYTQIGCYTDRYGQRG